MSRIYKLLDASAWEAARAAGRFDGAEIDITDGYIHFSTAAQAQQTASLHFNGRAGLVVLEVEAGTLGESVKWEPSRGGQLFPHLYGPLDTAQVVAVHQAPLGEDGAPVLPPLAP